jgi:plastocyanin
MRKVLALLTTIGAGAAFAVPAVGAPQAKTVKVGDYFFSPATLRIHQGTKVTWSWVGATGHNLSVANGSVRFHSRTQTKGTYTHVFGRKGTYLLRCTIHPFMKETIKVS